MDDQTEEMPVIEAREKRKFVRHKPRKPGPRALALALFALLLAINAIGAFFIIRSSESNSEKTKEEEALPAFSFSFKGDEQQGLLSRPLAVAIDQFGKIFVTDTGNRQIQVFDGRGKYLFRFGQGEKDTRSNLNIPCYIAISPSKHIYVSDRGRNAVFIYSKDGKFLRQFKPNNENNYDWAPLGLEFDEKGNLYVCDVVSNRVLVFDVTGKLKNRIGKKEPVSDQLNFPNDLAIGEDKIYVSDSNSARIQVFNKDGSFKKILKMPDEVAPGLPRGLALSSDGSLIAADALAQAVYVFNANDKWLYSFGQFGSKPNEFRFPNGIAINDKNQIFVVDRENNSIKVWER